MRKGATGQRAKEGRAFWRPFLKPRRWKGILAGEENILWGAFLGRRPYFPVMLTIRITGIKLQTARRLLGWSLQELATRSGVNWLTIKKYESAGDYLPPASVGALDRLVSALESAGVQFDVEGAHLDRAATMKAQVAKEMDRGAAA